MPRFVMAGLFLLCFASIENLCHLLEFGFVPNNFTFLFVIATLIDMHVKCNYVESADESIKLCREMIFTSSNPSEQHCDC